MEIRRALNACSEVRLGLALFLAYVAVVVGRAWVSEDAYITFRVIENFFMGYGLRWNTYERVQVYTHPLWLLLHIPFRVFIPNLFLVSILISVLCTCGAVWLTMKTARPGRMALVACLFVPLFASKCLLDFSTSGLESSLFYLLYAGFGFVLLRRMGTPRFWLELSLVSALMLMNRLDTLLFIAPVWGWLAWRYWSKLDVGQVLLGALPLAGWFLFALFYYGFALPNTKYAKLDTGISPWQYLKEGVHYAQHFLSNEPNSALVLWGAPLMVGYRAVRAAAPLPMMLTLGVLLYSSYVMSIGGDYMMARFWATPLFAAVWLLYVFAPPLPFKTGAVLALLLAGTNHWTMEPFIERHPMLQVHKWRMDDARHVFGGNSLLHEYWPPVINTHANHKFVGWGKKVAEDNPPPHAEAAHYIGMLGFYAGPSVRLIDEVALADPLLARLPVPTTRPFYIGHFYRAVPEGYLHAIKTGGDLKQMHPSLVQYYIPLRRIVAGELWSWERIKTIVQFHLGAYDKWKHDFLWCNVWA